MFLRTFARPYPGNTRGFWHRKSKSSVSKQKKNTIHVYVYLTKTPLPNKSCPQITLNYFLQQWVYSLKSAVNHMAMGLNLANLMELSTLTRICRMLFPICNMTFRNIGWLTNGSIADGMQMTRWRDWSVHPSPQWEQSNRGSRVFITIVSIQITRKRIVSSATLLWFLNWTKQFTNGLGPLQLRHTKSEYEIHCKYV